jgi:hypothetical protein
MTVGIRDLIRELSPPWLRRKWGERFLYAHGVAVDGVIDWAIQGVKARFPSKAPEEALPMLGRDRRIIRGFNEPASSYRVRLARWMTDWRRAGNAFALLEQVRAYLYGFDVVLRTVNDRGSWQMVQGDASTIHRLLGNWDWDGKFPLTARTRFWLLISEFGSLWSNDGTWGDGAVWGGDGEVVGFTATLDQVASLRQLVASWKPGGTLCPFIIVELVPTFDVSDPPPGIPNAQYENWGRDVGGVYRPARHRASRYVSGRA